jgi:hypothetical protein
LSGVVGWKPRRGHRQAIGDSRTGLDGAPSERIEVDTEEPHPVQPPAAVDEQ